MKLMPHDLDEMEWNGLAMKLLEYPRSYVAGFHEKLTVEIGQDGRAARILLLLTMQQLSPRDQRRHRQQQVGAVREPWEDRRGGVEE